MAIIESPVRFPRRQHGGKLNQPSFARDHAPYSTFGGWRSFSSIPARFALRIG